MVSHDSSHWAGQRCLDCGAARGLEFRRGAMVGEDRWICREEAGCRQRRSAQRIESQLKVRRGMVIVIQDIRDEPTLRWRELELLLGGFGHPPGVCNPADVAEWKARLAPNHAA